MRKIQTKITTQSMIYHVTTFRCEKLKYEVDFFFYDLQRHLQNNVHPIFGLLKRVFPEYICREGFTSQTVLSPIKT